MAIEGAALPKRLTLFEWRRWDLISSKSSLVIEAFVKMLPKGGRSKNRNNLHRQRLRLRKALGLHS